MSSLSTQLSALAVTNLSKKEIKERKKMVEGMIQDLDKSYEKLISQEGVIAPNIRYIVRNYEDDDGESFTLGALFDTREDAVNSFTRCLTAKVIFRNQQGAVEPTFRCYCVNAYSREREEELVVQLGKHAHRR